MRLIQLTAQPVLGKVYTVTATAKQALTKAYTVIAMIAPNRAAVSSQVTKK